MCVFAMVTCEWVVLFRACRSVRCLTTFSPRCVSLCLVSCLVVFTNALLPMPQPSTNHCIPPYPGSLNDPASASRQVVLQNASSNATAALQECGWEGHQGYLCKRGPTGLLRRTGWQKRWFVLCSAMPKTASSNALGGGDGAGDDGSKARWEVRYYTSQKAWEKREAARGYFPVRRLRAARPVETTRRGQGSVFEIMVDRTSGGGDTSLGKRGSNTRCYELKAENSFDLDGWVDALNRAKGLAKSNAA